MSVLELYEAYSEQSVFAISNMDTWNDHMDYYRSHRDYYADSHIDGDHQLDDETPWHGDNHRDEHVDTND